MVSKGVLSEPGSEQNKYSISKVSELTGVPSVTLRAWERRYSFLEPFRTPSGHRLYNDQQIALIQKATSLIDSGLSVSRVSDLLAAEQHNNPDEGRDWQGFRQQMLDAVRAFDEFRLDQIYENLLAQFSDVNVTREVIIPLMQQIGTAWENGDIGVAEEHFFSLYIRNKLGSRWHHGNYSSLGKKLVIACMPEERHEYGLLFFALLARARGFAPILLGADMPLTELARVVSKTEAAAVVLCNTQAADPKIVEGELKTLCREVPVPVFIGGVGVLQLEKNLNAVGAIPVGSELSAGVGIIFDHLYKG